jgi:hypothetical protein
LEQEQRDGIPPSDALETRHGTPALCVAQIESARPRRLF